MTKVFKGDITTLGTDAIVNAANESLLGGGGVDGAIHRAAGSELKEYCRTLGGCRTGEAKVTPGFALKARYVIHTVGPIWYGGHSGEETLLRKCIRNSMKIARACKLGSIAFPLISTGVYGYPKAEAMRIFAEELGDVADMDVTICCFTEPDADNMAEVLAEHKKIGTASSPEEIH